MIICFQIPYSSFKYGSEREKLALELIRTHPFITLIDSLGTSSNFFFKRRASLYICTTIALVGKVCGRFGAKGAEVTFRLFYWNPVKRDVVFVTVRSKGLANRRLE